MENAGKTLELLAQARLPQFEIGSDGYPLPGKVVKYYREQMTYVDKEGREKHWTQADLAKVLGLQETMVNLMEKHDKGLDSIERRRTLSTILRIPPVLLGLGSLDAIVEVFTGQNTIQTGEETKRVKITEQDIQEYKKTFNAYNTLFASGMSFTSISAIERITRNIRDTIEYTRNDAKREVLKILWNFEILCSKIYGSDAMYWSKAFEHIDNATEIAAELENSDLQAISLYTSGLYHLRQGKLGLTKIDVDAALIYANNSLPQTKGIVYTLSSWYQRLKGNTLISQKIFDGAEKYAGAKSEIIPIKFGKGTYLMYRGESLMHLNRPGKALEYLEDAERYISSSKRRLLLHLNIVRARCYMELRKPEYEQTTSIMRKAVANSKSLLIETNITQIEGIYHRLTNSPYGNAPDIVELGQEIQELKLIKSGL